MELSDENHCWQMLRLLVKVVYFAQALESTSGSRSTMATFAPSLRNLVFWGDHSVRRPRLFATRINSVSNWLGRWKEWQHDHWPMSKIDFFRWRQKVANEIQEHWRPVDNHAPNAASTTCHDDSLPSKATTTNKTSLRFSQICTFLD